MAIFRQVSGKQFRNLIFYAADSRLDYNRLLDLVDSVKQLPDSVMALLLARRLLVLSTTSHSHTIQLTNSEGKELNIYFISREWNDPAIPWRLSIGDVRAETYSPDITRFIQHVYPLFVSNYSRQEVLRDLVRLLYVSVDRR